MSQCGMDFQFIPLHIMYNYQHFESIQHFNGLSRYLLTFQINDPKILINLNDFPSFFNLMVQEPPIQLLQQVLHFYWNEEFDFTLMDILKNNWDSPFVSQP
jgi:hypothetical protein